MSDAIVATRALGKVYGTQTALADVDLAVPRGSVYGLVGPNGAGKTTLLSVLAGLRRPTAGSVSLGVARHEMALVTDTPRFEPWLTGREVVALAAALTAPRAQAGTGDRQPSAVDAALARAGLADAADRRTGGYSRGMLQRLGLAAAIVTDPALLVLDEPSSALDPAGRREVLDLVAGLAGSATVIFSSHVLADVQEVCDRVGILREGRLLFQGRLDDLLVGHAGPGFVLRVRGDVERLADLLSGQPWVTAAHVTASGAVDVTVDAAEEAERRLAGVLDAAGVRVVSVTPRTPDLERVFLELTGDGALTGGRPS